MRHKGDAIDRMDISSEMMEKARACKDSDELFALTKAEGVELTEDQLDTVAAGDYGDINDCDSLDCVGHDCDVYKCDSNACRDLDCKVYY